MGTPPTKSNRQIRFLIAQIGGKRESEGVTSRAMTKKYSRQISNIHPLVVTFLTACASDRPTIAPQRGTQVSAITGNDPAADEQHLTQVRPESAGISAVGWLAQRSALRSGARARDALRHFSQSELEEYGQVLRDAALRGEGRINMRGSHVPGAETPLQRSALDRLASAASGTLKVAWDDIHRGPADVENLLFIRRDLDAQGVWSAFLDAHFEEVSQIWGIELRSDLVLSGASGLGDDVVVLHGERLRDGIPVDGEFVEAFVTTASSPFGPGVLTRIKVVTDARRAERPTSPRERWLPAERATSIADDRLNSMAPSNSDRTPTNGPPSAQLRWSCGDHCVPYWRVGYRTGWSVSVGAIDGEVIQAHQHTDRIGPISMTGLPPGVSRSASLSDRTIRFRRANVVDSSGVSLGQTDVNGTHSFTQSTPVQIGLQGPVGSTNPSRIGRVERQDPATFAPIPLRVSWTPSTEATKNFGSPTDVWAPNSVAGMYAHSTALLFGWFTYWQALVRDHLFEEVPQRFAFYLNAVAPLACGGAQTGNFTPPTLDPNGSTTWASVFCSADSSDDVGTNYDTDGYAIIGAAHEFGHTAQNCASQSGAGCQNINPSETPVISRPPLASWRPAIWDSSRDPIAQLFGAVLSRYRYLSPIGSENYDGSWTYASYDSTTDDFATWSQDAGSTANCPNEVTCGSGFVCAAADATRTGVSPQTGICTRTCVMQADCQMGLTCKDWPTQPNATPVRMCVADAYTNHFLDTSGARMVFTMGWRDTLGNMLYATGGQSGTATRDFVLGTDSYYSRLLNNPATRFEVTRGVRSVYSGTGFVRGDDYPDYWERGAAIPVRSTNWTKIWWGNGTWDYPRFEDNLDYDVVLFRGVAGSSYRIETWFKDTTGSPIVEIALLDNIGTYWSSYTGSLTTPSLPTTGWYAATVWGGMGTQRWEGRMRVEPGSDDIAATVAEALPMVHSISASATADFVGDADTFQIEVPNTTTPLDIQVSGLSSATILLYDPSGNYYAGQAITSTSTYWFIPSLPTAGHWTWLVLANATGSYSTTAWLGCGSSSCDVNPGVRSARYAWGDRFAGRLPLSSTEHVYRITLADWQGVSVSVSDTQQPCAVEVSAYAPSSGTGNARNLNGQAIMRWTDGAAVADQAGSTAGTGGYIEALNAGTYEFRVRPAPGATCSYYRIHLATSTRRGYALPAW